MLIKIFHPLLISLILVFSPLYSPSLFATPETTPPPIKSLKVAGVLALTGEAANHGKAIRQGVEFAAFDLKQHGWKVEIHYEDDQTNPAKTVSAIQFLQAKGYRFFIGPTWSFLVNASKSVLERTPSVALVPGGSSEINGGTSPNVFNFCASRMQQVPVLSRWLSEKGYKRGYIITPYEDWGEIHRKVFSEAFKESRSVIVGEDQFDYGISTTTLQSILLRTKNKDVDLILTTGGSSDIANLIKARNILKLDVPIISTNDIYDALNLNLLSKAEVENRIFAIGRLDIREDFVKRYTEHLGEPPKMYTDLGYDALITLAKAIENTDGSVEAIKSYLGSKIDYQGVSGHIAFNEDGDVKEGLFRIVNVYIGQ